MRCFGNKHGQEALARYHDTEWGKPVQDDRHLFEMLILEGAQAGLNWEIVLKKRESYKKAFFNFDVEKVANMTDQDLETLLLDPGLIRNRLKIYSARKNAHAVLQIIQEFGSFSDYLWSYVDGKPIINSWPDISAIPVDSSKSKLLSKDLKKRGMSFVGPTIIYAFMQAVGMVSDHLTSCWLKEQ